MFLRFEEFLAKKWVSEKRFGLEGCEVMLLRNSSVLSVSLRLGITFRFLFLL